MAGIENDREDNNSIDVIDFEKIENALTATPRS
jgi:hypothetical protein